MPWVNQVPGIVQGWFLGTEGGNALASVLVGDVNPSGKLTFTFPVKLEDNGAHALGEFPGGKDVDYNEGIFVGYRWAEAKKIKPLFPFGHGLSYTTFKYSNLKINKSSFAKGETVKVSVTVSNTGKYDGKEVVQLYIRDLVGSLARPVKELKGFELVNLKKGESKTIDFTLTEAELGFFDNEGNFLVESGTFKLFVGTSSAEVLESEFELK